MVEQDVLGLDEVSTLGFVVERRRRQDAAAAEELRAVTHWADLHRVGPDNIGAVDAEIGHAVWRSSQALGLPGVLGAEGELRLAGQGAFRVCEFAVAELATALGMSEPAGRAYVGRRWSCGTGCRCAGTGSWAGSCRRGRAARSPSTRSR